MYKIKKEKDNTFWLLVNFGPSLTGLADNRSINEGSQFLSQVSTIHTYIYNIE